MIIFDDKNIKDYLQLYEDIKRNQDIISECKNKIEKNISKMKSILIKGYWYTYDVDIKWNNPKKYTIKEVSGKYITIREVVKKKPWKGFTGEHTYSLEDFLSLRIYKTEEEALKDYKNNDYIHKLSREITRLTKACEHYNIKNYNIPKEKDEIGSVWLRLSSAEITDRKWLKDYKDRLHPNDDWTSVNIETYAKWIHLFDREEADELLNKALNARVVGYLD